MRLLIITVFVLQSVFWDCVGMVVVSSNSICHDSNSSLVLDSSGDLAIAANDAAITRFAYDDGHRVTRAETLVRSAVFDIAF